MTRMHTRRLFGLSLFSVLLVAACATPTLVNFEPRVHVVQRGDTLHSIAWRHQLDVRQLVLWNELDDPDLILVAQRIYLTPEGLEGTGAASAGPAPAAPGAGSLPPGSPQPGTRQPVSTPPAVPAIPSAPAGSAAEGPATPAPRRPPVPPAAPSSASIPAPPPPGRVVGGAMGAGSANTAQRPAPRPAQPSSLPVLPAPAWQWPIRGAVVSPYGAAEGTGSGIGIGGTLGADIRASATGDVVYAGAGLATYGNLIIIKHNDSFLSAYGHNDELVVGEGDTVAQGEVIAKMGMGPERQPQVHFEIRRNGTPVDPLGLLPN